MLTIAWDVDDVLNNLLAEWLAAWCRSPSSTHAVAYEEVRENPPDRLLGITRDEYLASLDAFRDSSAGRALQPVPEVLDWFERNGSRYRHLALTARPLETAPAAAEWVMRHFGTWIRTFHFIPAPRTAQALPRYDASKIEYLAWLGKVDAFVDDMQENVDACMGLDIGAVVMPRPWNQAPGDVASGLVELDRILRIREALS